MSLELHLELMSKESSRNKELYDTWIYLKSEISKLLNNVSVYFPHFSLHDASHSKTICSQIERVLGRQRINELSISNTFALLLVAYCHDLGMAINYNQVEEFFKSCEYKEILKDIKTDKHNSLYEVARYLLEVDFEHSNFLNDYSRSLQTYEYVLQIIEYKFRSNHAKRSSIKIKEILVDKYNVDRIVGVRFINLIGRISELHQEDFIKIMDLPKLTNGIADDYLHPRMVATMLCLGDLLDLDTDRFDKYLLESVTPLPLESELHFKKHESIQHFLVCANGIEIEADTDSRKVYRILRNWVSWIEGIVNFAALNWSNLVQNDFGNSPLLLKKKLSYCGDTKWVDYSDLKFKINQNRAIELLQGANIYKSKYVFLREIIQNAIDSSVLQLWKEISRKNHIGTKVISLTDIPYDVVSTLAIELKLYVDNDRNVVVELSDKGCGISEEDVKRIANVGNTRNDDKSNITRTMPNWLRPSGAFGLGIQSIFLVADEFEVITKAQNEQTKKIRFESSIDGDGFIEIEDYNDHFDRGTKLKVVINPNRLNRHDLYCSKYHYSTIDKEVLIIDRLFNELNNDNGGVAIGYSRQFKLLDYIPVNIKCTYPNETPIEKLLYESVFNSNVNELCEGIIDNEGDGILFSYYDNKTESISKIKFTSYTELDKKITYNRRNNEYGQALFFKNEYVKEWSLGQRYRRNESKYYDAFDFTVNVLGNTADEMLTIDRRDIKKEFEYEAHNIIHECIDNSIKRMIDQLIKEPLLNSVDSSIIKIFEMVNYYNYMVEEFFNCYHSKLSEYSFCNYLSIVNDLESNEYSEEYTFDDLINSNIIFAVKEVDNTCFDESNRDTIKVLTDSDKVNWIKPRKIKQQTGYDEKSCIAHMIEKGYIAEKNGKHYYCVETKPFKNSLHYNSYEKDITFVLNDFLFALFNDYRIMKSNAKCLDVSVLIEKHGYGKSGYVVELILNKDQRKKLKKYFLFEDDTSINEEEFIESIINDSAFNKTMTYISVEKKVDYDTVVKSYMSFVRGLLDVIKARDSYRNLINLMLKEFNANPKRLNPGNSKLEEIILDNDYTV